MSVIYDDVDPKQLDIASHLREERDSLKYRLARYDDFWEWFEDEYGETEKEVWDKFEEWEGKNKRIDASQEKENR